MKRLITTLVCGSLSVAFSCGGEVDPTPVPGEEPPAAADDLGCDAGDAVWAQRALFALSGRRPESAREVAALVRIIEALDEADLPGRAVVADSLTIGPEYIDRWEGFIFDQVSVNRTETKLNLGCYRETTPAEASRQLAEFVRDNEADGPAFGSAFTMRDLARSSIRLDDVSPFYRADLFARMAMPISAANLTDEEADAFHRSHYGELFERTYLGREHGCLLCHNSAGAVTYDDDPRLNRHWAIDGFFEEAVLGNHVGRTEEEIHNAFRWFGFVDASPGAIQPWGFSAACGTYQISREGDLLQTPAYIGGPLPLGSTVYDVEALLHDGIDSLRAEGLVVAEDRSVAPDAALAWMWSARFVDEVWRMLLGSALTLPNGFARHPRQREILQDLTEHFVDKDFSIRALLIEVVTHPFFNQATPDRCDAPTPYPIDPVFNPFATDDASPGRQGNGEGDRLARRDAWSLLDSVAQAMWWAKPQRFGEGFDFNPQPRKANFLSAVGVFLKEARPGGAPVDLVTLLHWEQELGDGVNPDLRGDCTGPLGATQCASRDFVAELISAATVTTDATVADVAHALRDRFLAAPAFDDGEEAVVEALFELALDAKVSSVDPVALEAGARRFAGALINTPQFMLVGAEPELPDALDLTPALVVRGTEFSALCEFHAARSADVLGVEVSCAP